VLIVGRELIDDGVSNRPACLHCAQARRSSNHRAADRVCLRAEATAGKRDRGRSSLNCVCRLYDNTESRRNGVLV
jgi:hypothetical protein